MTGTKFERELRKVEREIIQLYSRRVAADRRTSTVQVLVDLRNSYGRRRGDPRTALPRGLLCDLGG